MTADGFNVENIKPNGWLLLVAMLIFLVLGLGFLDLTETIIIALGLLFYSCSWIFGKEKVKK